MDERAKKAIFVGYPQYRKGFILFDPVTRQHILSRCVTFAEKELVNKCYCPDNTVEPETVESSQKSEDSGNDEQNSLNSDKPEQKVVWKQKQKPQKVVQSDAPRVRFFDSGWFPEYIK